MLHMGVDRRDHDARLDGDQVDAHHGHAHPCIDDDALVIDDDALVEDAIENLDKTVGRRRAFNRQSRPPSPTPPSVTALRAPAILLWRALPATAFGAECPR